MPAGNVGNLPMVLVAALCEDQTSPVAHAVASGRCYELGIAYVVFAMWVAGEHTSALSCILGFRWGMRCLMQACF